MSAPISRDPISGDRISGERISSDQLLGEGEKLLSELVDVARALTRERDLDVLLGLILERSRFITSADAGSIYIVEKKAEAPHSLRFKLSQNDSVKFESGEFSVPVSPRSMAGAAVLGRKAINVADVYSIGADEPYAFDRSFDARVGYRSRSMITVPMVTSQDEVIGVIQLINKKRHAEAVLSDAPRVDAEVVPFDRRSQELLVTLAAQAGIALENAQLYQEIRGMLDGFVRASVQAIEQRDPTTSGHSMRVSDLSCELAQVVDRVDTGAYREATFSPNDIRELEYASLLHDFGKIGVREHVLVKAKKLYPHQLDALRQRFQLAAAQLRCEILERRVEALQRGQSPEELEALDIEFERRRAGLSEAWELIQSANEPTVLQEGDFSRIAELAAETFVSPTGEVLPLLTGEELACLQVSKGSLNTEELNQIRSHVTHTYAFLQTIPWGKSLARVPIIAGAHHERLNGTGYPNRLAAEEIPLQSKIMTIADIFDALTARDRPYKRAVPVPRALDILGYEVKDGHIDGELVRLFTEAKVFERVAE